MTIEDKTGEGSGKHGEINLRKRLWSVNATGKGHLITPGYKDVN
jgi:hypothetical protein